MQSKTARAAMRAGSKKNVGLSTSSLLPRLIPLDGGHGVYLFEPTAGKCLRLRVASDDFVTAIREATAAGVGDALRTELEEFAQTYPGAGWDRTLARLDAAGALSVPEEAQA